MLKTVRFVAGLCAIAALAVPATAQKQGIHEDTTKGFRIKLPEKWRTIPIQIDEKWIVAKFQCNRSYQTKARSAEDLAEHTPQIYVIEFNDEARKLRVEQETRGDTTYLQKNAPFRDYKDYLKRNISDGGWYIDKEEVTTEAGVPCTKYQVRIEKMARAGEKRLIAWVFRAADGEYAVECEVLNDHFEKLEPMMLAALKSFKLIPRTTSEAKGAITGENGGDAIWVTDRRKWRELPVEERQRRRKRIEEERMKKAQENLLPGWTAKRTKHYLVLSHADAKYTARIVEAIESYRELLQNNWDSVSDEYVMHGVIRICADLDEARGYVDASANSDSFNPDNREVVTYQDKSEGNAGISWDRLFIGMFDQYMYDKDALLYSYLPLWMHYGLHGYVGSARIKTGKLVLEPDDNENNLIREVQRANAFAPLKELMSAKLEGDRPNTDAEREAYFKWLAQGDRLIRFMYANETKFPELKGFINDYMKRTMVIAEEMDAVRRAGIADANSEEEERQRNEERKNYWKKSRTEIVERIQKDLNWSEETWAKLQKAFHDSLKK